MHEWFLSNSLRDAFETKQLQSDQPKTQSLVVKAYAFCIFLEVRTNVS